MDILLFLLIGQLLVFGTFASDKRLKEDPKTEQAIIENNENVTDLRCECVDIGYNNSGAPETFVTNGISSDNPGEPETSVTNEMWSDNSGQPETFVTNEMSSDNSGQPETLVTNEMDREYSANDDSPDKADDNDHCSSNPCKNEGTCIEEGDDYSCKCTHHWYSGKDCDKDDGPCETFCSERGTARCVYSGPGGTDTSCVCNAGYEGDKCDYFHDCAKNSLLTPLINICIERRMTNEECIRTATGIDKSVDSLDELFKRIDNGDIQISTIEDNLRIFFGDLDLFDLLFQKFGLGKLVSGSEGFIDNVVLGLIKEFGFVKLMSDIEGLGKLVSGFEGFIDNVDLGLRKEFGFVKLMPVIEGYKQQLQRQHQHSGDDGVVEVTEKYKKMFASL